MTDYIEVDISHSDHLEIIEAYCLQWASLGIEEKPQGFTAYFDPEQTDVNELTDRLDHLSNTLPFSYKISKQPVKNWNEEWEKSYEPITIDTYCGIYAPFHQIDKALDHHIIIDPRMAFGTGHHETTELMIRNMRSIDFFNKKVLDLGSGTGILAIMASYQGAAQVTAVDIDDNAYTIMQENFIVNKTETIISQLGTIADVSEKFDCILANINRNILVNDAANIVKHLNANGYLILSGFYIEDEDIINYEYESLGLRQVQQREKNNWLSIIYKN